MLLDARVALVTGAGRGNGEAIALGLAAEGARVIVTDIAAHSAETTARRIRDSGGQAWAFRLDVTDATECEDLAKRSQHPSETSRSSSTMPAFVRDTRSTVPTFLRIGMPRWMSICGAR